MMAGICSTNGLQYKNLGANHHMWTSADLWEPNVIAAQTRTATFTWFGGFTGGVEIFVLDGQERIVAKTDIRSYGVDGTWIGRSDRTEPWHYNLDGNVDWRARGAVRLQAAHFWNPDWGKNIDRVLAIGTKITPYLSLL